VSPQCSTLFCADLIAYCAGRFAGGLAGSLAFAAAGVLSRLLDRFCIDRNDVFCHGIHLSNITGIIVT